MILAGLIIAVSSALALILKKGTHLEGSNEIPIWLWLIAVITVPIVFIGNANPTLIPTWLRWIAVVTGLACAMIGKEKYNKDDRLTDWIDSKFKKIFKRS